MQFRLFLSIFYLVKENDHIVGISWNTKSHSHFVLVNSKICNLMNYSTNYFNPVELARRLAQLKMFV